MSDYYLDEPDPMAWAGRRPKPNRVCPECGVEFHAAPEDVGSLCDPCCDERDRKTEAERGA